MRLLKFILSLSLVFAGTPALAISPANDESEEAVAAAIFNDLCHSRYQTPYTGAACGINFIFEHEMIIDPTLMAMKFAAGAYVMGLVARVIVGDTPEVVMFLTYTRGGMVASTVAIGAGFLLGAAIGAAGAYFGSTETTAEKSQDEYHPQVTPECKTVLDQFKTPDGIAKLKQFFAGRSISEVEKLMACIPGDPVVSESLSDLARQGRLLENQIHRN